MNNKIEEIQHKISYLMGITSLGFELNSFEDYFAIFLKPKNGISYKIVFSLFPVNDRVFFSQLNYSVISLNVNSLMSFLDKGFNLLEDTLIDRKGFHNSQKIREDINILVLHNTEIIENNILVVGDIFKKYYSNYSLPFFSEFQSLQDINDKILEKEKWQDWSNYIFGKTYFKAMIILKLAGNEKGYQEFTAMYISRIEEGIKNGRDDLQQYLDDVIRLHHYLESGAYKNLLKRVR
ncbi:hypothetical protein BWK63_12760 [Flavobacterium covae]|uniref:DUF4304 domain-containing protein n=1 Tax=Flavobacterium covae TaxID=2906076 RepID=A0ABW8PKJ2_9FLAO|nr:hypothetical protein [Flavobacterium covae]OWP80114.1 hypothetical protein BWK63_12760 [Flavobacterium covae]